MLNTTIIKCSFCKYWSGSTCMVTPNSKYCSDALDQYYAYLHKDNKQPKVKSLRSWDK